MTIDHITARKNRCCYGMGLGIMILDDVYPGFPGDVRNMSSLLQVPLAQQVIKPDQTVGIYVGSKQAMTDAHLSAAGISLNSNYVVEGAVDNGRCEEFENLWIEGKRPDPPQAVYHKAEKEFLSVGIDSFNSHPDMGAMVLECTGFPPFARALQQKIDIPVFSYTTLLDYAYSIVVHRDFHGHV
jgi:hypothetical protein